MANPKSSGGNKCKGKGQCNRQQQPQSQQTQQPQQQLVDSSQLTPTPVAATGLEPPTVTPLASRPSEDTLALAAAVAASIPGAPLARPIPDRRPSTPSVVTPTSNNNNSSVVETPPSTAENLATSRTASAAAAAAAPSEHRRGIFQRLFGWSS
ncbi:protein giant [Drosophila gunungcola]|uniref:Uncharacterized protein n=1 Tax=Drosophila gunungcola TaxID=103775 RepID=A0A9P9YCL4_9MUSC|nr:protein giant [Drosophila gunungcola]KAI8034512.1 hypothetical protein M5D96_012699 [Drosophila gunungcola]